MLILPHNSEYSICTYTIYTTYYFIKTQSIQSKLKYIPKRNQANSLHARWCTHCTRFNRFHKLSISIKFS